MDAVVACQACAGAPAAADDLHVYLQHATAHTYLPQAALAVCAVVACDWEHTDDALADLANLVGNSQPCVDNCHAADRTPARAQ